MEDEMMHDDRNYMNGQMDQVDIEVDQVNKMTEITCWPTPA